MPWKVFRISVAGVVNNFLLESDNKNDQKTFEIRELFDRSVFRCNGFFGL